MSPVVYVFVAIAVALACGALHGWYLSLNTPANRLAKILLGNMPEQWRGTGFDFKFGRIRFTGWKYEVCSDGRCGQWLFYYNYNSPEARFFYVNMPGMECGEYQRGSSFAIGSERLKDATPEQLKATMTRGLELLLKTVTDQCPEVMRQDTLAEEIVSMPKIDRLYDQDAPNP